MTLPEFANRRSPEARFVGWVMEPIWSDPKWRGKGDATPPKPGAARWALPSSTHALAASALAHFCESIAFIPPHELLLEADSPGKRRIVFRGLHLGEIQIDKYNDPID